MTLFDNLRANTQHVIDKNMGNTSYRRYSDLELVQGEICVYKKISKGNDRQDYIALAFANGAIVLMTHEQDCCENVWIEDINGDASNGYYSEDVDVAVWIPEKSIGSSHDKVELVREAAKFHKNS